MNGTLVMRMLNGLADLSKERQALLNTQLMFVTEVRDLLTIHVLHDEVGLIAFGDPGLVEVSDAGVVVLVLV